MVPVRPFGSVEPQLFPRPLRGVQGVFVVVNVQSKPTNIQWLNDIAYCPFYLIHTGSLSNWNYTLTDSTTSYLKMHQDACFPPQQARFFYANMLHLVISCKCLIGQHKWCGNTLSFCVPFKQHLLSINIFKTHVCSSSIFDFRNYPNFSITDTFFFNNDMTSNFIKTKRLTQTLYCKHQKKSQQY